MYQESPRRRRHDDDDESYFVSLSDLMAGVLFLFIIMLTYFGLELQKTADAVAGRNTPVDHLKIEPPKPPPVPTRAVAGGVDVRDPRLDLMQRLDDELHRQHAQGVEVDYQNGALRFSDRVMFDGAGALTPEGRALMTATAQALRRVLPCYSYSSALPRPSDCPAAAGRVGAVFVEGHAEGPDAWGLSVRQAAAAFAALTAAEPALPSLSSRPEGGSPILSVGGYGASRPLGDDPQRNARLEMRIAMAAID